MNVLCIYHGNCADGFAAALAIRLHFGADNVDFHKGIYGEDPPDVTARSVIMVDFSYKRPVLLAMAAAAEDILILDHHKSAAEELVDLPDNVVAIFNMDKSGAVLAWEAFHPEGTVPELYEHIQDRDLWRFELDFTREICAAVYSYPMDFDVWTGLLTDRLDFLATQGAALIRKQTKDVADLVNYCTRRMTIAGYDVPVANVPYMFASDVGHALVQNPDEAFAATYTDTEKSRTFSLRSTEGGADVSKIAERFGGGGHFHAAGFKVPLSFGECVDDILTNPA